MFIYCSYYKCYSHCVLVSGSWGQLSLTVNVLKGTRCPQNTWNRIIYCLVFVAVQTVYSSYTWWHLAFTVVFFLSTRCHKMAKQEMSACRHGDHHLLTLPLPLNNHRVVLSLWCLMWAPAANTEIHHVMKFSLKCVAQPCWSWFIGVTRKTVKRRDVTHAHTCLYTHENSRVSCFGT